MKILFFANALSGMVKFRKELVHSLINMGHDVVISCPIDVEELKKEISCKVIDTQINRRGINPFVDYRLYKFYKKIIKIEKPDIVITYTIKPNIYGAKAAKKYKIPYFVNITGLGTAFQKRLLKLIVTFMYKISLKKVNKVFFENSYNRQVFIENKIVPKNRTVLLNGAGVNLDEFSVLPYPEENEPIRFLFIGRVMREKGIDEYFSAAEQLKVKYGSDIEFHILGGLEEQYSSKLTSLQEKGIIIYHGYQTDIKSFVQQTHCVVLPSYHEGMSNALLEAAAMGRPLIASDIPGCREAIIAGKTGYVCHVKDETSLLEQMDKFISLSYHDKKALGQAGRKYIISNFDKIKVVENVLNSIRTVVN